MDSWERFNETTFVSRKAFYSKLYLKDTTDEDYTAQKLFRGFEVKNLGNVMIYMLKLIHYFMQMYLKTLEINLSKYMNLILHIFYLHLDYHGKLV